MGCYSDIRPCEEATKYNDKNDEWIIEIENLDKLLHLIKKYHDNLIVSEDAITIYDDYVE